jgi:hypothetical protein
MGITLESMAGTGFLAVTAKLGTNKNKIIDTLDKIRNKTYCL